MLAVLLSPMPAAAMLAMLLSLSPHRSARRAAVAGLTGMLPDGRPCRRHAHHFAMLLSLCRPPPCSSCCSRCAGRRHARHAALAVPATATLAVPLWPGSPECYPTVARSAAMLTISPCCCRSAGRRNARRAALAVLLRPCRPPPCSSCCSRCPRYCYARRDAVTRLIGMLLDVRNSPPTPCSLFICRLRRHYACRSYA
ncbi:hypothetical protein PR001_g33093, partial [Phytophthora rubi]